ncbi:3-deoxy-manno-octulosonate cytidylyltransferase [Algoriphagus sp.]|uniref:3-deoxy-manno-octulosonate cytidylyltransferase n=1 Tax=Algoriphagus sp. TaxID=1872435 RepID=UPI0025DC34A2|nr:3-deoxy-manno-octulosonate cytidylyltransferase [Algoriphagus sp.]
MKSAALIPARYASTRLPAKLVQDLGGKTVIQRTYQSTLATEVFDEVWVVTDHEEIADQIKALNGLVFFSQKHHESGSDRIAEALEQVDADLIVNVQGDEPFQDRSSLNDLVDSFKNEDVQIASLKTMISEDEAQNPNFVKVVTDINNDALYFSRSAIPYNREKILNLFYWKHIGIYGYRRDALLAYTQMERGKLEGIEMLEQLRLLENGFKIRMVETIHKAVAIDTAEDLARARAILSLTKGI